MTTDETTSETTGDTVEQIETVLELPDDRLEAELPALLTEIEGQTEQLLMENPALFARVTQRMDSVDIAKFATEQPETVEQFQEMLWTGMELLVQASPAVQESITDDITVNFEATDADDGLSPRHRERGNHPRRHRRMRRLRSHDHRPSRRTRCTHYGQHRSRSGIHATTIRNEWRHPDGDSTRRNDERTHKTAS
jgi:hypothetical protein